MAELTLLTQLKGPTGDLSDSVNLGGRAGALDLSTHTLNSQVFRTVFTGNVTLDVAKMPTVPGGKAGIFTLVIKQDGTGSRTLTLTGIKRPYGVSPVLSTAANATDVLHFMWTGLEWAVLVGGMNIS